VTDAIEGRWCFDFGRGLPPDPGNEFILSAGIVTLAARPVVAGNYIVQPGTLTMTLTMPEIAGEDAWRMVAEMLLLDGQESACELFGIVRAITADDTLISVSSCSLLRRSADA
jgi:hypothetical protein